MTAYRRSDRKGAAAVELAVVLPVILLLFFGGFEIGRAIMVRHILEEGARAGCRVAVLDYPTWGDAKAAAEAVVAKAMEEANITGYVLKEIEPPELLPTNPDVYFVQVEIEVAHSNVAWLSSTFMTGKTITGTCVMPYPTDPNSGGSGGGNTKKNAKKNTKKNAKKGP